MSFQGLLQEMGVTVEMETSAGASWKEQTMSFLILCSTATSDSKVWECLIFKSQRKGSRVACFATLVTACSGRYSQICYKMFLCGRMGEPAIYFLI